MRESDSTAFAVECKFQDSPGTFGLAYHAYVSPNIGYPASRLFFIGSIDMRTGRPVVVG